MSEDDVVQVVRLTLGEIISAASVGVQRHVEAIMSGRADKHGLKDATWDLHIEGALGELAVCKAIDRSWPAGVNTFKGADIGERIQVRWRSKDWHDLEFRPDDNPDHYYFLVTGHCPVYTVWGWIRGRNAMRDEWWKDTGNRGAFAWWVPHDHLRRINDATRRGVADGGAKEEER